MGGNDLQTYIDILVPNNAKLTLIKGEGPIHLIGSHCIDFYDNMAGEADSEGEDEEMEEKGKGKDIPASPLKTRSSPADSKKRKASEAGDEVDNAEKKAKPSPVKPSPAKQSPAKASPAN